MEEEDVISDKLKSRYSDIHPWIFKRSCDYARTPGDLFDILEGIPKTYPIVWDNKKRQWITVSNICELNNLD